MENAPQNERAKWSELSKRLEQLAQQLERAQFADYVHLLNRPWRLIVTNLYAGIARGVGIGIGFTIFTTFIVYVLRQLGALNLPIIGDYIAEIVRIVQYELNGPAF